MLILEGFEVVEGAVLIAFRDTGFLPELGGSLLKIAAAPDSSQMLALSSYLPSAAVAYGTG